MSQSLSSIKSKDLKAEAIRRRINSGSCGLGYWAAVDALRTHHKAKVVANRVEPSITIEPLLSKDEAEALLSKANEARSKLDNWTLRQS